MKKLYKKLLHDIKKYQTIIIHRHTRPDGDALGSQFGLQRALKDNFKDKEIYAVGDTNSRLLFMGQPDEITDDKYKGALVIICDVAVSNMISDDRYKLADKIWIIDHHKNKSDVEENNLIIDSHAAAACEVIADMLFTLKLKVSSCAATSLFTGLVTDSGRFQYSDTSPKTLMIGLFLLNQGVDAQAIYDKLYVETLESKKLKAKFTEKMKLTEKNVAYIFNTKEDLDELGIDFNTVSRGMVNVMSGIEGINIWANFTYDATVDKVICEFRSRGMSIVDIAKKYGGGGHDQACGATIDSFEVAKEVLADFDKRMEEFLSGAYTK